MTGTGAAHLSALTSALSSPNGIIETIQGAVTNAANEISGTAARLYAAALPTADIVNAVVTVFPAYDVNLFLSGSSKRSTGTFSADWNMHSSLRLLPMRDCSHLRVVLSF
jgi:hypothetical protein